MDLTGDNGIPDDDIVARIEAPTEGLIRAYREAHIAFDLIDGMMIVRASGEIARGIDEFTIECSE